MCGGTSWWGWWLEYSNGLSPRVRGNRRAVTPPKGNAWSIPACAGEPRIHQSQLYSLAVYPRVCGGTHHRLHCRLGSHGLSPRVRGNLLDMASTTWCGTVYPRVCGEPSGHSHSSSIATVYPRVCGGTPLTVYLHPHNTGLSPRVRGNPLSSNGQPYRPGSIPACAGEPASGV